ncbi:hypothetical protein EZV62_024806 [Acer yangbiense]|uniref:SWIM-type domain-containing protein n=1 Tax=Acer yangbiense TaxID=1000413 RepID=A0A5C7GWH9_9ROSI|nr:hypothetical protein EZV62_024806 [Acer yangbiense]
MATNDIGLKCLNEKLKPKCGLEFDSEQSAYDFYNAYGRSMRFSVRKDTFGRKIFFFINRFVDEHNHPLVMEECAHMLPSQRTLSTSQAIEVDLAEQFGIPLKSLTSYLIPKTILTDQDTAMAKAISHVMPITYQWLCTWHMMQNVLKHVNGVFRGLSGMKSILSKFIDEIEEENQFLIAWIEMLEKYNAQNNNWLKSIFNIREKWAYTYVRHDWSNGMKSTQLSESFNVNLKDYLKSDLNVAQFFMHFERGSLHKGIFKELQDQFEEAVDLNLSPCMVDGESFLYIITDDHSREWQVKKEDNLLSCTCRMFEMKRFLCCHVVKVLRESMNIKEIPTEYNLKRWTKHARGESVQDIHGREIQADPKLQQTFRYRSLCSIFTRISSRAFENEKNI